MAGVRIVLLGCLLATAVVGTSRAQDSDASDASPDAEARRLFEAGTVAFDSGLYDAALIHYERAYELSGRPELLYNIGISAERARNDERALSAFRSFLEAAPDHPEHETVSSRVRAIERARLSPEAAAGTVPLDPIEVRQRTRRRRVIGGVLGAVLAVAVGLTVALLVVREPRYEPRREVGDVGGIIQAVGW